MPKNKTNGDMFFDLLANHNILIKDFSKDSNTPEEAVINVINDIITITPLMIDEYKKDIESRKKFLNELTMFCNLVNKGE